MNNYDKAVAHFPEPKRSLVRRVLTTLGATTDLTLAVLRGHLLIEELLWKGVESGLPQPQHLANARINFGTLVLLFKSIYGDGGEANKTLWPNLTRLNKLRNALSHNIDVPDLEAEVDEFVAATGASTDAHIVPHQQRIYMFTLGVAYTYGCLSGAFMKWPGANEGGSNAT